MVVTAITLTLIGELSFIVTDMPYPGILTLILFGVIGGLLSFGIMGLFIGPVVLALSYKLIQAWINEQQ